MDIRRWFAETDCDGALLAKLGLYGVLGRFDTQ